MACKIDDVKNNPPVPITIYCPYYYFIKPFGIKEEKRRFNPHLTLGRFRKGAKSDVHLDKILLHYKHLTSQECMLRELSLFKSDLRPGGAVYTKLNTWPLGQKG